MANADISNSLGSRISLARYAIPTILVTVLFLGIVTRFGHGEIFPFATWAMFSRVPSDYGYWTLRIHEINGRKIDPPQLVKNVNGLPGRARNVNAVFLNNEFGKLSYRLHRNVAVDHDRLHLLRNMAENNLGNARIKYEITALQGDPVKMFRDREYEREISLGLFYKGGGRNPVTFEDYSLEFVPIGIFAASDFLGEQIGLGGFRAISNTALDFTRPDSLFGSNAVSDWIFKIAPLSDSSRTTGAFKHIVLPESPSKAQYIISCQVWSDHSIDDFQMGLKLKNDSEEILWALDIHASRVYRIPADKWTAIAGKINLAKSTGKDAMIRFYNHGTNGNWALDDVRLYRVK